MHLKYIDDMTIAESINLKQMLVRNSEPNLVRPLIYHNRTEHILPEENYAMQSHLDSLHNYTVKHQMKINERKTKVILFNNAIKYDFVPQLTIDNGSPQQ